MQKQLDLQIKVLHGLYDREPIWQRYQSGTLEIHGHVLWRGIPICLCLSHDPMLLEREDAREVEIYVYRDKFPVFVGIGEVAEKARPLATHVRLKLADDCGVFVADAFEASRPMTREALGRILNRELRSVLGDARVFLSKDVDEVVQRCAEVVDDLPDNHARALAERVHDRRGWPDIRGISLYLCDDTVFAQLNDVGIEPFEIRDVFTCPFSTKEGAAQFIHGANVA